MDAATSSEIRLPDSMECLKEIVREKLCETFSRLDQIWTHLGIPEEDRLQRKQDAVRHLMRLFDEMLAEDKELLETALESVRTNREVVQRLQAELQMFLVEPNDDWPIIEAEEKYRNAVSILRKERNRRISVVGDLTAQLDFLHSQMGDADVVPTFGHVPSTSEIETLEQLVNSKRQLLELRTSSYRSLANQIRSLAISMDYKAQNAFEQFAIECKNLPQTLSAETIEKMDHFVKHLKVEHDRFLQGLEKMCRLKLGELTALWEECKFDLNKRQSFKNSIKELHPSKMLEMLEAEVKLLRNYYEERRGVFEKFEQWEQAWSAKVELESRCKDASRFSNRGGVLLQEERAKKTIERSLSRARRDVQEAVILWDTANPGNPVAVYGMPAMSAIKVVETKYAHERERERAERKMARQAQLESEATFGSDKSSTPSTTPSLRAPLSQKNKVRPVSHNPCPAFRKGAYMVLSPLLRSPDKYGSSSTSGCCHEDALSSLQEEDGFGSSACDIAKSASSSGCSS